MADKHYQVFVSSTFDDLSNERAEVMRALLKLNCFPAAMELFPASNDEQFKFIKRVIDQCDYYVLIVANRYGSTDPAGTSYTELEYAYACEKNIPVLSFVHAAPDSLPVNRSEEEPKQREMLRHFRDRVCAGRMVAKWTSATDLAASVVLSLVSAFESHPSKGWVRGDTIATADALSDLNQLRKRNEDLEKKLREADTHRPLIVPNIAGLDDPVNIRGTYNYNDNERKWKLGMTWGDLFAVVSPYALAEPSDHAISSDIALALFKKTGFDGYGVCVDDDVFQTMKVQFSALGLVDLHLAPSRGHGMLFWKLTTHGYRTMMLLRSDKRAKGPSDN